MPQVQPTFSIGGVPIPPSAAQAAAQKLLAAREELYNLRAFAKRANPTYRWYRWNELVAEHLTAVTVGEIKRLIVQAPPSLGKSELVSRLFPANYLFRHQARRVGISSYSDTLAVSFGRAARDYYLEAGGKLKQDLAAASRWATIEGGDCWSVGRGGSATGFHYDLGIGDDLIKDAAEASSATVRNHTNTWIDTVWLRRRLSGAANVFVWTRWDEFDPAGHLLGKEEVGEVEGWWLINLEAIKTTRTRIEVPAHVQVVDDGRAVGEPLNPERHPINAWRVIESSMAEYWWHALYQGRPVAGAGRGRVYNECDPEQHFAESLGDPGGDLLIGMDFNVDPMCAKVMVRAGDQRHFISEITLHNSNTHQMAAEITSRYWPGVSRPDQVTRHDNRPYLKGAGGDTTLRPIVIYPDPSAGSRRTVSAQAGETDLAILKSWGFEVRAKSQASALVDRYNCTNSAFRQGKLFVSRAGCPKLVEALLRMTYKPESSIPDKTHGYDHHTDAADYAVEQELPIPGIHDVGVVPMYW